MWTDAVDLRDFYASPLGRVAAGVLRMNMREIWPDVTNMKMLGLGYTTPLLGAFRGSADRTIAAMPAQQGVLHWPPGEAGLSALVDESELPFPDLSQDRVILTHALECSEQLRPMLREVWRVLAEGGRLMLIVPNRRGVWSRLEKTPFAHGQPYSPGQISRLLRDNMFTPIQSRSCLYIPPTNSRMMLSSARAWEGIGKMLLPAFGGIVIMEAGKEIYANEMAFEKKSRGRFSLAPPGGETSRTITKP